MFNEKKFFWQRLQELLQPLKDWLDNLEIHHSFVAKLICQIIPPTCPFERDVKLFGYQIARIPPLCKLNPIYEQLVFLRFRSLSYLTDEGSQNISKYI